jgi:hypothetical protein
MVKIVTKYIPSLKINFVYKLGRISKNIFELLKDSNSDDLLFNLRDGSKFYVVACFRNLTYNTLDDEMPNYYDLKFEDLHENQKTQILNQGALICKQYSRLISNKNVNVSYTKIENICKNDIKDSILFFNSKIITI